jgi:hypothetical protein
MQILRDVLLKNNEGLNMDTNLAMTEITLETALSIWWSMMWRTFILSLVVGFVLGAVGGFIVGAAGHVELAGAVGGLLGWLGGLVVSIFALKVALSKKHGGHSVVLVKS